MSQKLLLSPPENLRFVAVHAAAGIRKRGLESGLQASLRSIFQASFSIRFADADSFAARPAARLCGCARGGAPFRCGETSGF